MGDAGKVAAARIRMHITRRARRQQPPSSGQHYSLWQVEATIHALLLPAVRGRGRGRAPCTAAHLYAGNAA
jgi:hypothetical protein